ncbi:MAG: DUF1648 domain-containing protein [Flavobacteriaceae bacterium]
MNNKIEYSGIDYIIIGSSVMLTVLAVVYTLLEYSALPDEIPLHFNASGDIDRYGSKSTLWYVVGILTATTIGLFFMARATSIHNTQLKTRTANFRSLAMYMPFLGLMQLIVVYAIIESAKGTFNYSKWILPTILIITAIFLAITFAFIKKNKETD